MSSSPFEQIPPRTESSANEEGHENQFNALCEKLDEATKQTNLYHKIIAEVDDSGNYEKAVKDLRAFIAKRRRVLYDVQVKVAEGADRRGIDVDGAKMFIDELRRNMTVTEKFLGNGATCDVYTLRRDPTVNSAEMTCVKVVRDYQRYAEGRTVNQEMYVMERLRDLNVDGVFSPAPLFCFSGYDLNGLAMVHLDAVCVRRITEGRITEGIKDEFPPLFDVRVFEKKLRAYIKEMHGLGVVHNDLYLRNIMIDRRTGDPRVIDFGKALLNEELDKTKTSFDDELKRDYATVDSAMAELRNWLKSRA